MEFGKRIGNRALLMAPQILTESVPGQLYELNVQTGGVSNPAEAVALIANELPKQFSGLKVHWVQVTDTTIRVELTGSPFLWSALLVYLPSLLGLIGVIVSAISVYLVWSSIPSWTLGLLAVGIGLLFLGPRITGILMPSE